MPAGAVPPFRSTLAGRLYAAWAERIDRTIGWSVLPRYTGALVLGGMRIVLRRRNLQDTEGLPTTTTADPEPAPEGDRHLTARTADGSWNDLSVPTMGRADT
ncbi:MAG TPA: heme peroxidase, partial [Candidatus Dormibacteraeota bacterium]